MASTEERAARAGIVRCCSRLWDRRLVTGTSGNVSIRLDDGDVVVTPAATSLGELLEGDLVLVDAGGRPRDAALRPTSELQLHLAAYQARSDARCVIHTHPTFCVVWSRTGRVFPQDTVGARETLGRVGWVPYFPPGSAELARCCAQEFSGGNDTLLMERHGVSTLGPNLSHAFALTDLAEEAARIAYYAALGGHPLGGT
ncbi:MAG: class II aldolase/adducin family protein [Candidatus Tumulicola sp.]